MVFIVGQVDLKVGQVNFAELLARGQVLQKCICQPLCENVLNLTSIEKKKKRYYLNEN